MKFPQQSPSLEHVKGLPVWIMYVEQESERKRPVANDEVNALTWVFCFYGNLTLIIDLTPYFCCKCCNSCLVLMALMFTASPPYYHYFQWLFLAEFSFSFFNPDIVYQSLINKYQVHLALCDLGSIKKNEMSFKFCLLRS